MSDQLDFVIDNIGGVEHAELTFKPGVNVLRGPNGAGKTSSMNAVRRAAGERIEIEKRDGSEYGTLEGPGVKLKVGQVARVTGRAEVSIVDATPLSKLIDPQIKDREASARARIAALIDLLALGVDDRYLEILVDGDEALLAYARHAAREEAIDDFLELQGRVKKHAESLARAQEQQVERCLGEEQGASQRRAELLTRLGGEEGLLSISVPDAQSALLTASRQLERTEAACQAREELEARQNRVREALGERVDVAKAQAALDRTEREQEAAQSTILRLKAELEAAQVAYTDCATAIEKAQLDLSRAREAAAILEETPEGPGRSAVQVCEAEVSKLQEQAQRAELSAQARALNEEILAAAANGATAAEEATRLRVLAQTMPARLAQVLEAAGAPGFTVYEGRLAVIDEDGQHDFEQRLSDGQRISRALDVAARRYEGLVPLSGSFWQALDPEAKAHFAREAIERGLYVLTEQPSDGTLRVEQQEPA